MNDVKMMLGKRAAQYYLFVTWCIIAPVLMLVRSLISSLFPFQFFSFLFFSELKVITFSNLIGAKTMSNGVGGGYDAYVYPSWSQILGWIIFASCIIPIPLVYLIKYIEEYRRLGIKEIVRTIQLEKRFSFLLKSFSPPKSIQEVDIVFMKKLIIWRNLDIYNQ